ncbi:MAG: 50S ribosomal protein L20, partial [Culicoidibacterales bacterium]
MPRVKGGTVARRRRKKILKLAKGYYGSKHTLYKTAHEQVMKSFMYSYRDRRQKKRDFRKLWITRINAAARLNGMTYSTLINGLNLANIDVNRKMLAELAVSDAASFTAIADLAKAALEKKKPSLAQTDDLSKLTVVQLK